MHYLAGSHAATPSVVSQGVTVSGNQFILDGKPFTPEGFISVALLDTQGYADGCTNQQTTGAANNFGDTEISNLITKWHSNTVRMHVNQKVLAGPDGVKYAQHVQSYVDLLRKHGLVVMVDSQDESWACGPVEPLPSQMTQDAWTTLLNNTTLKDDPYIMFEPFNEPGNTTNTATSTDPAVWNWPDWQNGGRQIQPVDWSTCSSNPSTCKEQWTPYTPIGHQQMINYLRSLGVKNVIVVDGAQHGGTLAGVPMLSDPGGHNQIAYAVHPLYYSDPPSHWDVRFGYLVPKVPVIADAWQCNYDSSGNVLTSQTSTFFNYMLSKKVGVVAYTMDWFGSQAPIVSDTALNPNACGKLFQQDYTNYFASSSPTPTITLTAPQPSSTVSGSAVAVAATAAVASGSITSVVLKAGTTTLQTCSTAACSASWNTTALTNGSYSLTADTTASDGKTASTTETVTVSNSHPSTLSPPTALTSPAQTTTTISLSWQAASDSQYPAAQLRYHVYRNGGSTPVGSTTAGSTSFVDRGLSPGTYYSYTITASDPAGTTSVPSAALAQATKTPSCAKPAAPSGLSGHAGSPTSVSLSWQAVPNPSASCVVNHYVVSRNTIPLSQPTSTSYTDSTATPQTSYSYSVLAVETGNIAGASSTVSVTTPTATQPDPGPSAPTGVTATAVSSSQVNLSWSASSDPVTGIKGYTILRGGHPIGSATTTSFGDSGLSAATPYSYQVQAVSGGNKTATSAAVSVTSLPNQSSGGGSHGNPSSGGSGSSHGSGSSTAATVPPILQGTQSVGSGSDTGQNTTDNPTNPGSSTTSQLTTPASSTPQSSSHRVTAKQVAYLGSSTALVLLLAAAGYWLVVRPRRLAWRPTGRGSSDDPDFTSSHVIVGDNKHGPPDPPGPAGPTRGGDL